MLFNLCLAIITITAHASPHYLTVWIHFAVHISQNTHLHTRPLKQAMGRKQTLLQLIFDLWVQRRSRQISLRCFRQCWSCSGFTRCKLKACNMFRLSGEDAAYCCTITKGLCIHADKQTCALRYNNPDYIPQNLMQAKAAKLKYNTKRYRVKKQMSMHQKKRLHIHICSWNLCCLD